MKAAPFERPGQYGRLAALLGPTNTGKTHFAIDRMLGYRSGMIGFPLRLLARENYDRVVKLKGRGKVALVTGEEKIVPPGACYFLCTVESMPVDRPVEFLAIDEVQLCADQERGHVFTDRLLYARGDEETLFLGAETIRPLVQKLVPKAEIIARPRFSKLAYAGAKKLSRLPPRSAVIAFSAAQVYELAELMRRQRGGTAVVLGALSPRTRNAQVALFEDGEVDYLVATDAIGMGLNLSLDHVAFSALSKFDGRAPRRLFPAEVAQIAGRAGRHMNDGTFGTTGDLGPMDAELVAAVEEHRFDPHVSVMWRNPRLDFHSMKGLIKSLERYPQSPELIRTRHAEDHLALLALARDQGIQDRASDPGRVALLWEICQVPDFRKMLTDQHLNLLRQLFQHLTLDEGRLPPDWVDRQIRRIDRTEGDIDALITRIAHVRTWTYITHRSDWIDDSEHWQARTRDLEDKLSDALHDRLTQRFVDRRTATLVRRLQGTEALIGSIRPNGEVLVEGEFLGRLEGFRFALDTAVGEGDVKSLLTAARRALTQEIPRRVAALEQDRPKAFKLSPEGQLTWHGAPVAFLAAGSSPLQPRIKTLTSEFLDGAQNERIRKRLATWLDRHLRASLPRLFAEPSDPLSGPARGLLFQLIEAMGALPRKAVAAQIRGLSKADRKALASLGVRLGAQSIFFPALMKPKSIGLRVLLWTVYHTPAAEPGSSGVPAIAHAPPLDGRTYRATVDGLDHRLSEALHLAAGYRCFQRGDQYLAIRAERLEHVVWEVRKAAADGVLTLGDEISKRCYLNLDDLAFLLPFVGYQVSSREAGLVAIARGRRRAAGKSAPSNGQVLESEPSGARPKGRPRAAARKARKGRRSQGSDSPFAKLRQMKVDS